MVRVCKGNTELRVADNDVAAYLEKGYAVIDSNGDKIVTSKAYTYEELATMHKTHERTIQRQGARISAQDAEIADKDGKIKELEAEIVKINEKLAAEAPKTSSDEQKAESGTTGSRKTKASQNAAEA